MRVQFLLPLPFFAALVYQHDGSLVKSKTRRNSVAQLHFARVTELADDLCLNHKAFGRESANLSLGTKLHAVIYCYGCNPDCKSGGLRA